MYYDGFRKVNRVGITLKTNIKMASAPIAAGAYSAYTCKISKDAEKSFKKALEGIIGVSYSPVAVAQQVVAGINYKFFCNTKAAVRYPLYGAAIVTIYQPLDGPAHVTNIEEIH